MSDTCADRTTASRSLKRKRPDDDIEYDGFRPAKRICFGNLLATDETDSHPDAQSTYTTPELTASTTPCSSPEAIAPPLDPEYYLNLPSYPDLGISLYEDDFGARVCEQYVQKQDLVRLRRIWREQKYGVDVAKEYRPGDTPDSVRDAYEAKQQRMMQEDEDGWDSVSEDEEGAIGRRFWEADGQGRAVAVHETGVT